jgi:membrane-associated phospholipid phosphatase
VSFRAGGLGAALVLGWCGSAAAQAAPNERRSDAYYYGHIGASVAFLAAGTALRLIEPESPGLEADWFPGDCSLRRRYAPDAARMSDVMLFFTVMNPVVASVAQGVNWQLANRGVVYSEALSVNLALNSLAKVAVARPRPYTYAIQGPPVGDRDRYVSFYSGHASTTFAAAVTGSYLFAEAAPDPGSRYIIWGSELFLASATATLRTRAGKHYYSDVVVGALVGLGLGVGEVLLHGAEYAPEPAEYAVGAGGIVLGAALARLLPFELEVPGPTAALESFELMPWSLGREGIGARAVGTF